MLAHEDAIVAIPPNRIKYFGTTGRMLLPSPATVAALIQRIPRHKLSTTVLLRTELSQQFEVEGTCPVTTQRALQAIAYDDDDEIAYWRIINQNGGLIARYPGGPAQHAALLQAEGFMIDPRGRVADFKDSLVNFRQAL